MYTSVNLFIYLCLVIETHTFPKHVFDDTFIYLRWKVLKWKMLTFLFVTAICVAVCYICKFPLKQRQRFRFNAHLFSEVTEVSKVWLLHFTLDSFLRSADKMRNLTGKKISVTFNLRKNYVVVLLCSLACSTTVKILIKQELPAKLSV